MSAANNDNAIAARTFGYDRTVALGDGVFALALTLLILTFLGCGAGRRTTWERRSSTACRNS